MTLLKGLKNNMNKTTTMNGANALKSTNSGLTDLFGVIGALRNREEADILALFSKAFCEDRLLAMKLLFYARDVRGGLGERRVARIIYRQLANIHPEVMRKNLGLLSEYGRWDDLLDLLDTKLKDDVIALIEAQLVKDIEAERPSLLAKWLPSINTSSKITRQKAQKIMTGLHWNAKKYRQTLSKLRKQLNVVEVNMSSGNWIDIEYSKVPSNAMNIYSRAFSRNDEERFMAYINAVKAGEEKINASVLYPYNITEKILYGGNGFENDLLEQQWYAMPDFVEDNEQNILVMADVSGSMYGRPMATSIGLALYFAEKTKGAFANHFMTFSSTPSMVEVIGDTLFEKVQIVMMSDWGMNTDFEKALKIILDTALAQRLPQSDMPESLVVISDMQFDQSLSGLNRDWTFYRKMKEMYKLQGYKIPEIVFWNVNSLSNVFQVESNYEGVKMASGQSASVFKSILCSTAFTPYDYMLEVLNNERYADVVI